MLTVNGQKVELDKQVQTIDQLLAHYNLKPEVVIVELNSQIVEKSSYAETILQEGDTIELVHFVGGG